jgi:hypothetical protein
MTKIPAMTRDVNTRGDGTHSNYYVCNVAQESHPRTAFVLRARLIPCPAAELARTDPYGVKTFGGVEVPPNTIVLRSEQAMRQGLAVDRPLYILGMTRRPDPPSIDWTPDTRELVWGEDAGACDTHVRAATIRRNTNGYFDRGPFVEIIFVVKTGCHGIAELLATFKRGDRPEMTIAVRIPVEDRT